MKTTLKINVQQTDKEFPQINEFKRFSYRCYICEGLKTTLGFEFKDKNENRFIICAECSAELKEL